MDIDGLRGVAILLVVLFHCRIPGFEGGFVGVDVFFVISGFLITGMIRDSLVEGNFSLRSFYLRRARRILPAFFAMMIAVTLAATAILTPRDLFRLAKAIINTVCFTSNFLMMREAGYFDGSAHDNLLLHTWSLSVEEQFYIIWPLLLWSAWRTGGPRRLRLTMAALFIASLVFAEWAAIHAPRLGFYMLPSRAAELLIGAFVAGGPTGSRTRIPWPPLADEALAALGLLLILGSALAFDSTWRFPGVNALIPSLGAALVIHANGAGATWTGRALALRPLRLLGLMSYSLYLWHWPLLALAGYALARPLAPLEAAPLAAAGVVIAALSWRCIEQPFRRPTLHDDASAARRIVLAFGGAGLALILVGAVFSVTKGLPWRAPASVVALEQLKRRYGKSGMEDSGCLDRRDPRLRTVGSCVFGAQKEPGRYDIVVWGDSHAAHYLPAIAQRSVEADLAGAMVVLAGCPPLLGVQFGPKRERGSECVRANEDAIRFIEAAPHLKTVILGGWWTYYAEANRFGEADGAPIFLYDAEDAALNRENTRRAFGEGVRRTLARLQAAGVRVLILGPGPEFARDVIRCLTHRKMLGLETDACAEASRAGIEGRQVFASRMLRAAAEDASFVRIVPVMDRFCDAGVCHAVDEDGALLFHDSSHFTLAGARRAAPVIDLKEAVERPKRAARLEEVPQSARISLERAPVPHN